MKVHALRGMLGVMLFAGVMSTGYAHKSLLSYANEKAKAVAVKTAWVKRHLLALGLVRLGIFCNDLSCKVYNNVEVAHSLARGKLSSLYRAFVRGEENEKLYYYVYDNEARIGWLENTGDDKHTFKRYIPSSSDQSWLSSFFQDTVYNDDVVGKLSSSDYPLFRFTLTDTDGTEIQLQVVASFMEDEYSYDIKSKHFGHPLRYVVLVTHSDGQELPEHQKYFRIIRSEEMRVYLEGYTRPAKRDLKSLNNNRFRTITTRNGSVLSYSIALFD